MDTNREVSKAGPSGLVKVLAGVVVNIFVAILIWILGAYVFLPLAPPTSEPLGVPAPVVSVIILVGALVAVVRVFVSIRELSEALAVRVARRSGELEKGHWTLTKALFYMLFGLGSFAILYLLGAAYAPFREIAVAVVAIWAILFLFSLGDIVSEGPERATRAVLQTVKRVTQ